MLFVATSIQNCNPVLQYQCLAGFLARLQAACMMLEAACMMLDACLCKQVVMLAPVVVLRLQSMPRTLINLTKMLMSGMSSRALRMSERMSSLASAASTSFSAQ